LNNVSKHARAQHVTINLRCATLSPGEGGARVELRVLDDGCGFDASLVPPERLGLGIMRERAESIGAVLEIESQPEHGTQITAMWEKQPGADHDDE
jgi:signal transduction histidine kinase